MKERFCSLYGWRNTAVTFGTFHGIFYGILKWAYGLNQSNILSDEEKISTFKGNSETNSWEELKGAGEEKEFFQELSEEIGNVGNNAVDIEFYESRKYGKRDSGIVSGIYETEKKQEPQN